MEGCVVDGIAVGYGCTGLVDSALPMRLDGSHLRKGKLGSAQEGGGGEVQG